MPRAIAAAAPSPISPEQSLALFQLDAGLKIELVACEPEVVDPVAIRFDEDGRLWVVEMRDYPHGPPEGKPPLSRIRVLDDADGDGRYEAAHTFAEELLFANGIQPWRGGLIVTLAGEVAYLQDTDGDGRADLRETWFQGFTIENPQLRANHPKFGLDNRIYVANGLRGGTVIDARRADAQPLSISGRDFTFDPISGKYEAVTGNGQFGLTFDDFGNRFVCNNRQPMDHAVLENRYLARNPLLAVPTAMATVAAAGDASQVFPLAAAWTTSNLHAGQFTAACGVEVYRGDALGADYLGNAFVCEPTGSLVHREILAPQGVTFAAKPATAGREFLASPDAWFRPVNLEVGPDGALYVVDMYRAVIEHPQYMPSELQNRPDLRLGDNRGRIYRIVRADRPRSKERPKLSRASAVELVEVLSHPNAWWRETAARLLYERQDKTARSALEALAMSDAAAPARVAALWVLEGQRGLSSEVLHKCLDAGDPRVREQAVVLAEARLAEVPALRERVMSLAGDADARVRFRVALAIGGLDDGAVIEPLAKILLADPQDAWTRYAVCTARGEHLAALLERALKSPDVQTAAFDAPVQDTVLQLATLVGARRDVAEFGKLVPQLCGGSTNTLPTREAALTGLGIGLARRGETLSAFVGELPAGKEWSAGPLSALVNSEVAALRSPALSDERKLKKLDLLRYLRGEQAKRGCLRLVEAYPSQVLRMKACAVLAAYEDDDEIGPALVKLYSQQSPSVRSAILDAMISRPGRARLLLEQVHAGTIARGELGAPRETSLRQHADPQVRERAASLLAQPSLAERAKVVAEYRPALGMTADPHAGRQLFQKHCAACHRIGGIGVNVAPDISDSRVKTPEQLLVDILNPNQAIDNNYVSYTVVTADGQVHTGVISAETDSSITLRQQENKTLSLVRGEIESIRSNGVSLMPEGFEKQLNPQQFADVVSFVKNWRYLEQPIPGTIAAPGK